MGNNSIVAIGDCSIRLPERTSELQLMMCSHEIFSLKFDGCFRDLAVVDVSSYDALTYLLTLEMLGSLKSLKKICVRRCEKMECIIQPAAVANPSSITLPELKTFVLLDLPNLKSICHGKILNCPSLHRIEVWNCKSLWLPKLLLGRKGIVEIRGETEWLDKVKEDSPSLTSTLRYCEASEPSELSNRSSRLRRPESFVGSRTPHQSSLRSFGLPSISIIHSINRSGVTTTNENVVSGGSWKKLWT